MSLTYCIMVGEVESGNSIAFEKKRGGGKKLAHLEDEFDKVATRHALRIPWLDLALPKHILSSLSQ